MSDRLKKKAAIKRASQAARANESKINALYLKRLEQIYTNALDDINAKIRSYAGPDDSLSMRNMQQLKDDIGSSITELNTAQQKLLKSGMTETAKVGAGVFIDTPSLSSATDRAVVNAINFMAEDGLQLSDRIWRVNQHTRSVIEQSIENAVIQGYSASQAAQEFLSRGERVPAEILKKMQSATPGKIKRILGNQLMRNENGAYYNARRLFRTEINRAYGMAYQVSCFEHEDVVGTKYMLSPNHRVADICDMHASVNKYGLGPGVYPKGKSPWPAHPQTRSYEEPVFKDEVNDEDRAGKQSRTDWLKEQSPSLQTGVLGARIKQQAFTKGLLNESEFTTPYRLIKNRLAKRGL